MPRVTQKDVARAANVSVSTVSFALSGGGSLSPETIERIRRVAEEMGYVPNPLLASLASRRFKEEDGIQRVPLAFLEWPLAFDGSSRGVGNYRQPLMAEAERLGYQIEIEQAPEVSRLQELSRMLYHRGVQGIVVTGSLPPDFLRRFESRHFSWVQCGRYQVSAPFHTVRPNTFQAIKLAFSQLHRLGYQRIGFAIGQHETLLEDDEARLGAAEAMMAFHQEERIPPLFREVVTKAHLEPWLKKHRPDAVIGFSLGTVYQLRDLGYRIPDDLGFVALHLDPNSVDAPSAGLNQDKEEVARQSILLMDQLIRHKEVGIPPKPVQLLVSSLWVDGKTIRTRGAR